MKNFISKAQLSLLPLAVACFFSLLFTQCNADRHDLPKEYNILRFKMNGQQMENPTKCGEWLSGCDPITTLHGVEREGTLRFSGGGADANGNGNLVYIYIESFN